mgnify:CR=1 FL=1
MEAAEEIARQLRLRDIGGIIVIDFIDMKLPENRRKVQESLEDFMKTDRARHSVLPISKLAGSPIPLSFTPRYIIPSSSFIEMVS